MELEKSNLKNIPIIYNPSYAEDTYKNTKNINNKKFDLLFAGNIGPATSVETIIEAANILRDNNDIQLSLFDENEKILKDKEIDKLLDNINSKLGKDSVYKASSIDKDK